MALILPQEGANGVASVTLTPAAGGGDSVFGGYRAAGHDLGILLVVRNADASSTDVTVPGYSSAFTVPATTGVALIPIFGGYYGATKAITYSKVTSLTVGSVKLGFVG